MKRGSLGIKTPPRRQVHKHARIFGTALPTSDFCVDPNIHWPNQNDENAPTECVGYTGADILCDIFRVPFSADWIYMRALQLMGVAPNTEGADPHRGLQALVAFGAVPRLQAPISAFVMGELYMANPKNWPNGIEQAALEYTENGVGNALGSGDHFTSIITACRFLGYGVSVSSYWYSEFEQPDSRGIVSMPAGGSADRYGGHNYLVKGMKTIDGKPYAMVKSHQGKNFGDNGWIYMDAATLNYAISSTPGGGALTLLKDASRLISLINIITEDFPSALPQLISIIRSALAK